MHQSRLIFLVLVSSCAAFPTPSNDPPSLRGSPDLLGHHLVHPKPEYSQNIPYNPAPGQNDNANLGQYLDLTKNKNPQPIRGSKGGTDPGPRDITLDKLNSDKFVPPGTDHGQTINAQWPMGKE